MLYKYGKQTRDFGGVFIFSLVYISIFWGAFNKTIIPFALVGYEIGYSQLISNACSWNNCYLYMYFGFHRPMLG